MGWWQGPWEGLAWFLLLHTTESRECVVWRCSVNIQWGSVGGGGDPKAQTSLCCRLTQTAGLVGPVRLLRECVA